MFNAVENAEKSERASERVSRAKRRRRLLFKDFLGQWG